MTAAQLPLPLPARDALGREAFFVSPANALAVAQIEAWQTWPARKCVLTGPEGSGKTHLAHVWAGLAGARIVPSLALVSADIPTLASGPICVEDVQDIAGDRASEEALFHLHNLALSQGHSLLVSAKNEPQHWGLTLPDLQSRMQGAQLARLSDPDDSLLVALLAKLFDDRQLHPGPDVLTYLARHMPRSHAEAQRLVAALDAASLAKHSKISRSFAAGVLRDLTDQAASN